MWNDSRSALPDRHDRIDNGFRELGYEQNCIGVPERPALNTAQQEISDSLVTGRISPVLAFGKRLLVDEPELGARFMAAYLKGIAQYNEGKTDRNVEIIAQSTSESVEVLKNACWIAIPSDGKINFPAVETFQEWSVSQGQLETPVTEDQFWDPGVLDMAFELLEQ